MAQFHETSPAKGNPVILSAAKDLMPVATGDEILRCAQDDRRFIYEEEIYHIFEV
jgi:hypothetical protein